LIQAKYQTGSNNFFLKFITHQNKEYKNKKKALKRAWILGPVGPTLLGHQ
jgi:hypothetical protein